MPNLCHGNGDLARDGCCYVAGQVCPLRWKIENGTVTQGASTDLGTVQDLAQALGMPKGRAKNLDQVLQGRTFVCSVAAKAIAGDTSLLRDPDALADAWDNDPDYLREVRPTWADLEQRLGMAPGTYQCSTWRGVGGAQCCFAEPPEENATKAANLGTPQAGIGVDQD